MRIKKKTIIKFRSGRSKVVTILVIVIVFILTLAGSTVYWGVAKIKKAAESAFNVSKKSVLLPPEKLNVEILTFPSADVAGNDFEEVERFPGAVRSNYYISEDKIFSAAEYYAPASSTAVIDFYKEKLPKKNWLSSSSNSRSLTFFQENSNLTLEIIAENKADPIITKYSLNLTKSL